MRTALSRSAVLLPLLALAACGGADDAPDAVPSDATAVIEAPAPDTTAVDTVWTLTSTGYGPVRYGMSVDEARAALGGALVPDTAATRTDGPDACHYATSTATPKGVWFMLEGQRVVRIDVDTAGIRTDLGAAVGDSEARIDSLYGTRVQRFPHKYVETGRELVVPDASDTTRMLLFETDGQRVTAFRGGMLPGVRYVEGCS